MRVGLIGFGAIGQQVADGIARGAAGEVELVVVLTRRPRQNVPTLRMVTDVVELLATRPAIVVEAASVQAVATYAEPILASGTSLILASTAALVDDALRVRLESVCEQSGARVYVPAGALAGVDALNAAAAGGLDHLTLHVTEPGSDSDAPRVVFEGTAADAARQFPSRLNVAWTVALAAHADAAVTLVEGTREQPRGLELRARGAFGKFVARMEPQYEPGRLSHIVALSQLATLRRLQQPIQVG